MTNTTLLVRKDRVTEARLADSEDAPLAPGEVRVRIELASLTANNITYAAFGEAMNYWRFFPAADAGWGIVPVWGFGTVLQSLHPGVAVGERLYGYWPMARHAVLRPDRLGERGFVDATPHRAELPAAYNHYQRSSRDPFYTPDTEEVQSVLRPLATTSWLLDDFLADQGFFGARRVLLSSASSKTAYGLALHLQRRAGVERIGFTSAANRAFCESLACYDRVLTYEELERLEAETPCVYVDFAGNADFRARVHSHCSELRYSCAVGGTHLAHLGGGSGLPGPKPVLFFAPSQAQKRQQDWGAQEFGRRAVQGWIALRDRVTDPQRPWLRIQRHEGPQAMLRAYQRMAAGEVDPALGHVVVPG